MHKIKAIILLAILLIALPAYTQNATQPTNLSLSGIADWTITGQFIASGTATPSYAADEGELYVDVSTATTPVLWRHDGSEWREIAGGSGGSGTSNHSELNQLGYAESGHVGFVASQTLITLEEKTDNHIASGTDPHGSDMTLTGTLTLGTNIDTYIGRIGTGTVRIASYTVIPPDIATPTAILATGTLWYDSNVNKLKCYDGAAWNTLW